MELPSAFGKRTVRFYASTCRNNPKTNPNKRFRAGRCLNNETERRRFSRCSPTPQYLSIVILLTLQDKVTVSSWQRQRRSTITANGTTRQTNRNERGEQRAVSSAVMDKQRLLSQYSVISDIILSHFPVWYDSNEQKIIDRRRAPNQNLRISKKPPRYFLFPSLIRSTPQSRFFSPELRRFHFDDF